jgi:HK97 family phage prohead protease
MNRFFAPLEIKFGEPDEPAGTFTGYGSVFGNMDSHGDVIVPGAFKNSLATYEAQGRKLSMYMQHGFSDERPVGVWDSAVEDSKGLLMKGRLLGLETETGKYNYALVKGGAMRGLSIGFRVAKADYPNEPGKPRRMIKEINVHEVSLVDQPSNPLAQVDSVKAAIDDCKSVRDFEEFLRREYGFSRSEANVLTSRFKSICLRESVGAEGGPSEDLPDIEALAESIRRITGNFK